MPLFKNLNYGRLLFESLRNYFSVNTEQKLAILYKYCAALIFPLQGPFDAYSAIRRIYEIVANCKWQIGQLTNVLNYLFDPLLKRIYISQAVVATLSAPKFPYITDVQVRGFGDPAQAQARKFNDRAAGSNVTIHVPGGTDLAAITATIEQIKVAGIPYEIIVF